MLGVGESRSPVLSPGSTLCMYLNEASMNYEPDRYSYALCRAQLKNQSLKFTPSHSDSHYSVIDKPFIATTGSHPLDVFNHFRSHFLVKVLSTL